MKMSKSERNINSNRNGNGNAKQARHENDAVWIAHPVTLSAEDRAERVTPLGRLLISFRVGDVYGGVLCCFAFGKIPCRSCAGKCWGSPQEALRKCWGSTREARGKFWVREWYESGASVVREWYGSGTRVVREQEQEQLRVKPCLAESSTLKFHERGNHSDCDSDSGSETTIIRLSPAQRAPEPSWFNTSSS